VLAELDGLPTRRLGPEAFVFGGDKPWPAWRVWDKWHALLEAAKVRYRHAEMLRHTFASALLSRNAPLLYVQKTGGLEERGRAAARLLALDRGGDARPTRATILHERRAASGSSDACRRKPGQVGHDARAEAISGNV
jgi:hypothetical protein